MTDPKPLDSHHAPAISNNDLPRLLGGSLRARALLAGLAALLLRLPFVARRLWDHDSVQFALGAEAFDLAAHHPHPPGYPLYIGWIRGLGELGVGPLGAMLTLGLLAAFVGAAAAVVLGERWARLGGAEGASAAATGWLAGGLWITCPTLWFYGELPLVYAVEASLATLLAVLAVEMAGPRPDGHRGTPLAPSERVGLAAGAAALYAAAAGLRPSTVVLLAPLMLWGLLRGTQGGHLRWKAWFVGGATGLTVGLAWGLPFLHAVGGLGAYREISGEHFQTLLPQTSVLYGAGMEAVAHHLEVLVKWTLQGLVPAAAVAFFLLAGRMAVEEQGIAERLHYELGAIGRRLRGALPWMLVWVLPPVAFFLLFHITKAGYTFVYLPALLVATAVALGPLVERSRRLLLPEDGDGEPLETTQREGNEAPQTAQSAPAEIHSRWLIAALVVVLAVGGSLFFFGSQRSASAPKWQALFLHEHNLGALRGYERELNAVLEILQGRDPVTTALITVELAGGGGASADGYVYPWHRHLQWYAPGYVTALLAPDAELALVAANGHEPLTVAEHGVIPLPPRVKEVLFVLSPPGRPTPSRPTLRSEAPGSDQPVSGLGERFPLPPAEVLFAGERFRVLATPFTQALELGNFLLVAGEVGKGTVPLDPVLPREGVNLTQEPDVVGSEVGSGESSAALSSSAGGSALGR